MGDIATGEAEAAEQTKNEKRASKAGKAGGLARAKAPPPASQPRLRLSPAFAFLSVCMLGSAMLNQILREVGKKSNCGPSGKLLFIRSTSQRAR